MWNTLQRSLVRDNFNNRLKGLVTNEYTYRYPNSPDIYWDDIWEVTSGSLFAESKKGYTGVPDHLSPNDTSSNGNNSAVFRCRTKRADLVQTTALNNPDGSVAIDLWIDVNLLLSATDTGSVGGSPITQPGRAGVRGNNCKFYFDNFQCDPALVLTNAKLNTI